jgi:NAD(P)H-dependent FMN reductase
MNIQIIVGSTRHGRGTHKVAAWVDKTAQNIEGDVDFEVVDLKDFDLPMFNESMPPQNNPNRELSDNVASWLEKLEEADGYIFVTPEYNHSIPASLKSAIDHIDFQIKQKPVAIVSHGAIGGARANEHLRLILNSNLGAISVPETVTLNAMPAFADVISEEGVLHDDYASAQSPLESMITSVVWYSEALKVKRESSVREPALV